MSNQYNNELIADMARAGKPSCREDNKQLYPLVAAGDADARRHMIEGNMSLVVTKVDAFLAQWPGFAHLRDDLMSAGFMGLVRAVTRLAQRSHDHNLNGFLGVCINRELKYLLESEQFVKVPHSSRRLAQRKGKTLSPPSTVNVIPETVPFHAGGSDLDMRDLFNSCCDCEEERTILAMCEAEHTYAEIAKAIGRPPSSTYAMARKVKARIQEKLESLR